MNHKFWQIGTYLPECIISNEDIHAQCPDFSCDYARDKLGIEFRHISKGELCVDMAYKAVMNLKDMAEADVGQSDMLIFVTQTPDYPLPSMSCVLQDRMSLPQRTICFDINMGCSGYIYALSTAYSYINSGLAKQAIVVTSERYSKYISDDDYANRGIFGDAATATLVTSEMAHCMRKFAFWTDGSGYNDIIVPDIDTGFVMNGPEVMAFSIKRIPQVVKDLLSSTDIDKEDIDYFVFHQGNQYMLKNIQHRLGINEKQMVYSLKNTGNTVSSSIPIAINSLIDSDSTISGTKMLLCGFGVGLSVGAVLIDCF